MNVALPHLSVVHYNAKNLASVDLTAANYLIFASTFRQLILFWKFEGASMHTATIIIPSLMYCHLKLKRLRLY